eukprot:5128338-Amphidinium_carterae.2
MNPRYTWDSTIGTALSMTDMELRSGQLHDMALGYARHLQLLWIEAHSVSSHTLTCYAPLLDGKCFADDLEVVRGAGLVPSITTKNSFFATLQTYRTPSDTLTVFSWGNGTNSHEHCISGFSAGSLMLHSVIFRNLTRNSLGLIEAKSKRCGKALEYMRNQPRCDAINLALVREVL